VIDALAMGGGGVDVRWHDSAIGEGGEVDCEPIYSAALVLL
jgi:hypothetical protein